MSFAKRLILGTLFVLISTIAVLVWGAERSLRHGLEAELASSLERSARLVRAAISPDSLSWPAAVRRFARENGIRITLIDQAGRVRADSDYPRGLPPAADSARADSLLAAPDVKAALAGGHGVDIRRGSSGRPTLRVTLPGGPGVIRVSAALDKVDDAVHRARAAMLGAAVLALVVGTLLAFVAARSITLPLTGLAGAARDIAAGSLPRFPRSGIPEIDGLVSALRDMHRQLAERFEELRRERGEIAALSESMIEGVIAADGRGRIVTANEAARRLLGYEADEPLPDLPELFRAKAAREIVDAALAGRAVEGREIELAGSALLVTARPMPSRGALLVLLDLSELRRLEAVRRDFVANVSHELKTPLTSISGYAETLLTDAPDGETSRRFLTTILANARRMQRLVDDLLDLSRIERGGWQPAVEPVNVAAAAEEAWSPLADRAAQGGVAFAVDVAPDAATVSADPDALRQVLGNLLDNSLRHTPAGGRIACIARREGAGVSIAVQDTGRGIAREHLPRIFERFYRADPGRTRGEGGTGLGLAIVKHLVEAHGGRVTAESERGRGTTVRCWFPDA
ncbi:MAG TPA: ATP-binding protein [Gemmatimonadales bacterium]|nr:ATP-binding protein [Gemmatimonadales bacterium]